MRRSRARACEAAMVLGTVPWLVLTLRPEPAGLDKVFLTPFSDLGALAQGPPGFFVVQLVGNLLVFAALGFFLPIRYAAFAPSSATSSAAARVVVVAARVTAAAALGSLAIEVTQFFAVAGRVFSVDDIMLNAVGAGLAAVLSRPWWRVGVHLPDVS